MHPRLFLCVRVQRNNGVHGKLLKLLTIHSSLLSCSKCDWPQAHFCTSKLPAHTWHTVSHIIFKLCCLLCLCLDLKLEVRRDVIASSIADSDHTSCEGNLGCCLPDLRKPGIIQVHLQLAALVLRAPIERQHDTFRLDKSVTTTTLPPLVPRSTRLLRRNHTTLTKYNLLSSITIHRPPLSNRARQYRQNHLTTSG